MTPSTTTTGDARLNRTLTTPKLVFIIVAAAAPLAAMLFTVPLSFSIGNGAGVPAMFVFAGLTLLCFSVGYVAISRRIVGTGGFYNYIAAGLGRPLAVGSGFIAIIAYNATAVGVLGAFAYFAGNVASAYGLDLSWHVWAAAGIVLVGAFGYRNIELSARVLSILMILEMAVLLALDLAVLVRRGGAALPAVSFAPGTVFGPGAGLSMMFGFASFIGFESAALYGEEARAPRRSVPRATVIAVLGVASFYAFTSWVAVGAVGPSQVRAVATDHLGDLFFDLGDVYLATWATAMMQILLCTSLFAGWLALHNAASRYLFVYGRERLLPRFLDVVHPVHKSMSRSSLAQTAFSIVTVSAFALAGLDPYTNMSTTMLGVGTLAILVLQALASLAVLNYFRRRSERHWWRTGLAPLLGVLGLGTAAVLVVSNFAVLTGTTDPVVTSLPWVVLAAGVLGVVFAQVVRRTDPEKYAGLAVVTRDGPGTAAGP